MHTKYLFTLTKVISILALSYCSQAVASDRPYTGLDRRSQLADQMEELAEEIEEDESGNAFAAFLSRLAKVLKEDSKNSTENDGWSPPIKVRAREKQDYKDKLFQNAIVKKDYRFAKYLLNVGADINSSSSEAPSWPLLRSATVREDTEDLKFLAENGAQLDFTAIPLSYRAADGTVFWKLESSLELAIQNRYIASLPLLLRTYDDHLADYSPDENEDILDFMAIADDSEKIYRSDDPLYTALIYSKDHKFDMVGTLIDHGKSVFSGGPEFQYDKDSRRSFLSAVLRNNYDYRDNAWILTENKWHPARRNYYDTKEESDQEASERQAWYLVREDLGKMLFQSGKVLNEILAKRPELFTSREFLNYILLELGADFYTAESKSFKPGSDERLIINWSIANLRRVVREHLVKTFVPHEVAAYGRGQMRSIAKTDPDSGCQTAVVQSRPISLAATQPTETIILEYVFGPPF